VWVWLVSSPGRERQNYCHLAPRKRQQRGVVGKMGMAKNERSRGSFASALPYEKLLSFAQHKNRKILERMGGGRMRMKMWMWMRLGADQGQAGCTPHTERLLTIS